MEKVDFEVTGRLGELQLQWLQQHYSPEQLAEALAAVTKRGQRPYPLNVARWLQSRGGPAMPKPGALLEADPQAKEKAAVAAQEALQRLRVLRARLG